MKSLELGDLTLDNIGQWPLVIKYVAVGIAAALVIGIGYWIFIQPNFEQYETLQTTEVNLRATFESKQRQAANLDAYRNQLQIMNERFGHMIKQLPAQTEMPALLEDISKTGIAAGLTFELFAPKPEIAHDFYYELPIDITVVGKYHQLAVFLSRIVEMSRIVTLHDFDIVAVEDDKKSTETGDLLRMKILAKIYRYRAQ